MKYRRITCYVRRNNQPCYSYPIESKVRAGKSASVAHDAAFDIMKHETRSGAIGSIQYLTTGAIVRVLTGSGLCKFIVKAG